METARKKSGFEWDLNDWRWDADLLTATPLNPLPSFSDDFHRPPDLDKRRRHDDDDVECLSLGWNAYPIAAGKKTKLAGPSSTRAVCQVVDCHADLTGAKDYYRRHKVCEVHSKAAKALVADIMQRFCQQCSRFHVLQEFDDGKRSCRRRLAGHNKRRRKANPESSSVANGDDERSSSYLLVSLLRILSNMQTNSSGDQSTDQDLLSHLLGSLASLAGVKNIPALLQGPQASFNNAATPPLLSNFGQQTQPLALLSPDTNREGLHTFSATEGLQVRSRAENSVRCHNIDLNCTYDDSQDNIEDPNLPGTSETVYADNSTYTHPDLHKSSPPQPSWNSDSTTTQSPSNSSGDAPSRTDRIVFKLFGKDPSDLPIDLRMQILNWLSNSPTDIESYIRPGCIILTIYLHLQKLAWEELRSDLGSSLKKLLDASSDSFWSTGWVYSRVGNSLAFSFNGHLVLDTPLPLKSSINCRISSIKPVAVSLSERTEFVVKGSNLFRPSTRLLCAFDGKYLVQEDCHELMDNSDSAIEHDEIQCLRFSCPIPSDTGRGFIEVEDHGLSSSFFPFIVAEQEVCSEICTLEGVIEQPNIVEAKNRALDFIHEMGWLLHRSRVNLRLGHMDPFSVQFPMSRLDRLLQFSMDHDWCYVVNKLLGIAFDGIVDSGESSSVEVALLDMDLLHRAVRRNCRPMVELLLKFVPPKATSELDSNEEKQSEKRSPSMLFKPDNVGPRGLTPLHVAACQVGCESVLDALTSDPAKVGVEAWQNARDETGLTPNDYARLRGHFSYIHLVHHKITKGSETGHVVVDIPGPVFDSKASKMSGFEIGGSGKRPIRGQCGGACRQQRIAYGNRSSLVYRPAMLSMLAIAAVCVCVALLFKSSPEVLYVFQPFRWERLKYGSS